MVVFAKGQHGAAAIKGVPADAQRSLGEIGLELRGQSGERFELAVLFDLFILGERGPIGRLLGRNFQRIFDKSAAD
jgi:hypothetical protein